LASKNEDSDRIESLILLFYIISYVALGIILLFVALSVKVSSDARLDLSVLGNESVRNLLQDQKVNISNYVFLALAIICKIATSTIILLQVMGYI